ncbi:mitochondrial ribosomal death-associated protein 3-domain-containing protein [Syncephalis fuscata]|nr:mitochondrial ribosomal death-associated protein 3-domain-containing protein [Syncephalis fuscata]
MRIPQNITALLNPPHGYPKDLGKDFNTTYNDALMVRESTFKALQLADATQKTTDTSLRVLLTGEAGAGKSATLLQTVSHCLSHKWLVLYVPNAISWVNGSTAYTPMEDTNPVSYKQTSLIQSVLKHFKQMNHSNINELKLSKDYSLGKINLSKQNTLLQLIDEGISNEAMTPVIWTALIDELTSQTSTPVLVAVDQVNVFYTKADYHHSDGSQLMPHELHLIKPLVDLFNGSRILKHGLTIGAMSLRDARMGQSMPVDADNAPTRLLRFPINNFTVTETMSMLDYYYRAQVIFEEPSLSMAIIKHTTTNGNARGLLNSCIHLV